MGGMGDPGGEGVSTLLGITQPNSIHPFIDFSLEAQEVVEV